MKIDVEAVAAKYGGRVHLGGVVAPVNKTEEWIVRMDDHGNLEWTDLGLALETAPDETAPRRRTRRGLRISED